MYGGNPAASGQLDEVHVVSLGDERHRPGCAQIAFDDLHLIVLLAEAFVL